MSISSRNSPARPRFYHYNLLCAGAFSHLGKKNFVRVLTQTGKTGDPRLADVPTVHELMEEYKTPELMRGLAALMLASDDFGRPIIALPAFHPIASSCCAKLLQGPLEILLSWTRPKRSD